MSNPCPDNSTACLLQAILQANSSYNWDPLTFGFTAIFTVIAFVVSVFALFQSFVAAGPGRLKASKRAIGEIQHSRNTVTHFSWEEFRFRTSVNVPVLDINKILDCDPTIVTIDAHGASDETRSVSIKELPRVVAGWSQLLNDLSLSHIDFDTIECLTDYLPGDVPAAPAWARVETIVLLSVIKGCLRLREDDDGFIWTTGPFAQLGWNMHPELGPIAVFRTWDVSGTIVHSLQDVQMMIPIFRGELYLGGNVIFKVLRHGRSGIPVHFDFMKLKELNHASWDRCKHQHDHCFVRKRSLWSGYMASKTKDGGMDKQAAALSFALFADRPKNGKAFPTGVTMVHSALKIMYEEYFPWLILADDLNDHVLEKVVGSSFVEFEGKEAVADMASVENENLMSWLCIASDTTLSESDQATTLQRPALYHSNSAWGADFGKKSNQPISGEKFSDHALRISRNAVRHVSRWLADETYFTTTDLRELGNAKHWLKYQLLELDWFLSSMGDDVICAASNLVALGSIKFGVSQFTKLPRRFVMPETLDAFNLTWTVDPEDEGSIVVNGCLDRETVQRLFAYSRDYIEVHRQEVHAVKCPETNQGFFYSSTKPHPKWKKPHYSGKSRRTDDDKTEVPSKPPADSSSVKIPVETKTNDVVTNINELVQSASWPSPEQTDPFESTKALSSSNSEGDQDLRELLVEDQQLRRASAASEETIMIDPRISALEALTFFRAGVYGALLASGADTSLLLTSEKRYELVQVQ